MEEIMKQMMLYRRLSIVCLVGMIFCIVVAVYIYRKTDIREVLGYFWRNRKRKMLWLTVLICGMLSSSASLQVFAAQTEENITEEPVVDAQPPTYEAVYADENGQPIALKEETNEFLLYYNAAKEITFTLKVEDEFLDEENTTVKIVSSDRQGNLLKEEILLSEEGIYQAVMREDGHYKVQAHLIDLTGNETIHEMTFALDYEPPKKPEIRYVTENSGTLARLINQLTFGYFAKEKVIAHILVEDLVSSVKQVTYTYQDVDKEEIVTETIENVEEELQVELPFSFKGILSVQSKDYMGNQSEHFFDIGVIAESEDTHQVVSDAGVNVLTEYSKTPGYYAGNVKLEFLVKDTYSGIRSVSYLAGKEFSETISYEEGEEIVTEEVVQSYTLLASENPENNVQIGLSFLDNAGHETIFQEEKLPKIHIDTIAPKVWVVYDNHDVQNEKYYRESRTATIYIEEKNFDPEDVEYDLDGPVVEVHSWSHEAGEGCEGGEDPYHTGHSDKCVWKCEVEFTKDGEYRFGFSCVDLAGNEGRYDRIDEFIIDQTAPVIRVAYDNYDVRNEFYYNQPRRASIVIEEENFRSEDIEVSVTAENEGQILGAPAISGWTSNGALHQAVIAYDYDAVFSFDMDYTDLAGNAAEDYQGDAFCIDLTKPQIVISEVTDRSANNGAVSPVITASDTNYLEGSVWFELSGWKNGKMDAKKALASIPNGMMVRISNLDHIKENDDLYHLLAGASDLAGNTAEVQIRYSLNRFGSVYILDPITEALTGKTGTYYTTQEKRLVITETNVDTLLFKEIVCSLNGKLKTLKEDVDYVVEESGDDASWKQYRYVIDADNFSQEGHYTLTVYSEDRARNLSDNQSKGKSISFAVDKSAPSIVISGVEQEGRYRENSREILLDVEDNLALKEVKVILDGEVQVYEQEALNAGDGIISVIAQGKNEWQTLQVSAKDRAGNEISLPGITFLVTPNVWVQIYHQKPLFYGSIVMLGMIGSCLAFWMFIKIKSQTNKKI